MRNEYTDFLGSAGLPVLRIALLASDDIREALYGLLGCHLHLLRRATLVAPQATAILCEARFGLSISWINRGLSGGVSHVAELVAEKSLDAVIFLRDSDNTAFDDPDGDRLLRVCDNRQVPVATNAATAHALLPHLERSECAIGLPLFNDDGAIYGVCSNQNVLPETDRLSSDPRSLMIASLETKTVSRTRRRLAKSYMPTQSSVAFGRGRQRLGWAFNVPLTPP